VPAHYVMQRATNIIEHNMTNCFIGAAITSTEQNISCTYTVRTVMQTGLIPGQAISDETAYLKQ